MARLVTYYVEGAPPYVAATHLNQFIYGSVDAGEITAGSQTGSIAAVTADNAVVPGITLTVPIEVPDAATGNVDVVLTYKMRITDVTVHKTTGDGGAANTVQVFNGANAVSDVMSINVVDTTVVRAATINDANYEIAAGGTLRITRTKVGGNAACKVFVRGYRVA